MRPILAELSLVERYDENLRRACSKYLPAGYVRPQPTRYWPKENIELYERYNAWLLDGGVSEMVTNVYHVPMAGHVLGLMLKPYQQLDPDTDLECALDYIKAKGLGDSWIKNCRLALIKFRRFLRLERGLGEETRARPYDVAAHTTGLPQWLVSELERYQHLQQRNWRPARMSRAICSFWGHNLTLWRFLCEQRDVVQMADVKRQHVLDYLDQRLASGHAASGVNGELRCFHTFLLFLQDEGYAVPQSLLRIPGLKLPDRLPKYLTDEQIKLLRDEIERRVRETPLASRRRQALLVRAAFYLLWQGGLRLGEVEELRLEDLDFPAKKLTVRSGKGLKDRAVYLTDRVILVLQEYLAVRGTGSGDHVFLFRNAPIGKCMIRDQLKYAGESVGLHVYPHRLRHTCATQLLNAGCRVTSIQRFLGHKELRTTMIYARAHDQTVADDYFAAMERVEQRLDIAPLEPKEDEVVKEPQHAQVLVWVEQLAQPELCFPARLEIVAQLRQALGRMEVSAEVECLVAQPSEHPPPFIHLSKRRWP